MITSNMLKLDANKSSRMQSAVDHDAIDWEMACDWQRLRARGMSWTALILADLESHEDLCDAVLL